MGISLGRCIHPGWLNSPPPPSERPALRCGGTSQKGGFLQAAGSWERGQLKPTVHEGQGARTLSWRTGGGQSRPWGITAFKTLLMNLNILKYNFYKWHPQNLHPAEELDSDQSSEATCGFFPISSSTELSTQCCPQCCLYHFFVCFFSYCMFINL